MAYDPNQDPLIYGQLFGIPPEGEYPDALPSDALTAPLPGDVPVALGYTGYPEEGYYDDPVEPEGVPVAPVYSEDYPPTIDNQMAQVGMDQEPPGEGQQPEIGYDDAGRIKRIGRSDSIGVSRSGSDQKLITKRSGSHVVDRDKVNQQANIWGERLKGLTQKEADAAQAEADAQTKANAAEADNLRELAAIDEARAIAEEKAQGDANQRATERIEGIKSAVSEVASTRVDPARFWNDNSTAGYTAGMISAFIGGFLQPVLGTNTIQKVLDDAVANDLAAQRTDLNTAQNNVSNLKMLHQAGLSQDATEAEQRIALGLMKKASVLGMMEAEMLGYQDPVLQAKAAKEIAGLNKGLEKDYKALHDLEFERDYRYRKDEVKRIHDAQVLKTQRYGISVRAKNARDRLAFDKEREKNRKSKEDKPEPEKLNLVMSRSGSGPVGEFITGNDAAQEKFRQRYRGRGQLAEDLSELRKMVAKTGSLYRGTGESLMNSDEGMAIIARSGQMFADYLHMQSGSAAAAEEVKRLTKAIRNPESWTTGSPMGAWDETILRMSQQQDKDNNQYLRIIDGWSAEKEWIDPTTYGLDNATIVKGLREESLGILRQDTPLGIDPDEYAASQATHLDSYYKMALDNRTTAGKELSEIGGKKWLDTLAMVVEHQRALKMYNIPIKADPDEQEAAILAADIPADMSDYLLKGNRKVERRHGVVNAMADKIGVLVEDDMSEVHEDALNRRELEMGEGR